MAMAASSSSSLFARALALTTRQALPSSSRSFTHHRFRPLVALSTLLSSPSPTKTLVGFKKLQFSTRPTTSSLNDPSPNWNNRPPKETILLDGCDFEHWLIVMEKPEGDPTRDDIIDGYIKTLAQVVGSEEEARMKIYSVSTKHYFAFGCLVSEELSYKIKELPKVRWVLPDSYLDVRNKDYGGEPFINGQAVPYDPKYHEEWVRNNARANERSRRNDRPRNFDRSRNFERRRENMQTRDGPPPPMPNRGMPNSGGMPPNPNMQQGGAPNNMGGGMPPQNAYPSNAAPNPPPPQNAYSPAPNMGGAAPQNAYSQNAAPNMGGAPPQNAYGQHNAPNMGGMPPQGSYGQQGAGGNMGGGMPMGGMPPQGSYGNMGGGMPQGSYGQQGAGGNMGGSYGQQGAGGNMGGGMPMPPQRPQNFGGNMGGMPNTGNFQNGGYQNRDAPPPMPNRDYQVRDIPGRDNQ